MGGSLQSMVYVGSVKNVMNEDFGEVGALPRLARGQTRRKWTRDGFLAVLALRSPEAIDEGSLGVERGPKTGQSTPRDVT